MVMVYIIILLPYYLIITLLQVIVFAYSRIRYWYLHTSLKLFLWPYKKKAVDIVKEMHGNYQSKTKPNMQSTTQVNINLDKYSTVSNCSYPFLIGNLYDLKFSFKAFWYYHLLKMIQYNFLAYCIVLAISCWYHTVRNRLCLCRYTLK